MLKNNKIIFSLFLLILISSFCLIASIGDILLALLDGIIADIPITIIINIPGIIINKGLVTRCNLYSNISLIKLLIISITHPIPI